ncbi:MAG: hypothetical protein SGI77_05840 [Pirellulaceae bacterium]|nr:hypothetical protein [Pirellulaceae bacterium]
MIKLSRYLPRFRNAYRSFRELESRESWSRSQIEAFQLQRLNEVWSHAIQHVAYYRKLHDELGLPTHFQSLSEFTTQVPLLNKTYLRNNTPDFYSDQARPGRWHRTSGSTSFPLKAFREHAAHQEMLRTNYRYYRMWGHDIFDRMVFLWNMSGTRAQGFAGILKGYREFAEDKLRNRLRLSANTLGKNDLQGYLRKIADFKPSAIYSYSRAAYLLALEAKEQGFVCPSLKVINLTSEPVSDHIVRTVEQAFGAPCIIQYGCVEFGFIAGQWPDRTLRVREDIVFLETVPREDGFYDIALTSLNNPSFPLLRYDIGDVTEQRLELPEHGFAILKNISGRCGDMLYTPNGRCLHPTVADTLFEEYYYQYVRRYQIHQRVDHSMLTLIELNDSARIPDLDKMAKHISQEVDGCPVEVRIVSEIQQTAAGKHRSVISEIRAIPGGTL